MDGEGCPRQRVSLGVSREASGSWTWLGRKSRMGRSSVRVTWSGCEALREEGWFFCLFPIIDGEVR